MAPAAMADSSESPGTYSMTRNTRPSSVSPKSVISTMLSWFTRFTARASRRKRSRWMVSRARSRRSVFTATSRSMSTCRARYTVDMPPLPSREIRR
mgnify:CR=1 FL=1